MTYSHEEPYDDDVHYEESPAEQFYVKQSWDTLCTEIKSRARFFSPVSEKILNELFGDLNTLTTFNGTPVVQTISPDSENGHLYRARIAKTEHDVKKILMSPVNELGAPPSKHAQAGRMNPVGISVFYGAADPSTCVAEIRPPVGSHVVIGKFKILRDVRLLDMDKLTKLHVKGSYFDPASGARWGRAAFLRQIVTELTLPMTPGDEEFGYLPIQVIAEYLSEKVDPKLDGVIFHSSQITDKGNNIVLFNHASLTEPYTLPESSTVYVNFGWTSDDDSDDSISVWEELPKETEDDVPNVSPQLAHFGYYPEEGHSVSGSDYEDRDITLRLDVKNIEVQIISGALYSVTPRYTSRHTSEQSDHIMFKV